MRGVIHIETIATAILFFFLVLYTINFCLNILSKITNNMKIYREFLFTEKNFVNKTLYCIYPIYLKTIDDTIPTCKNCVKIIRKRGILNISSDGKIYMELLLFSNGIISYKNESAYVVIEDLINYSTMFKTVILKKAYLQINKKGFVTFYNVDSFLIADIETALPIYLGNKPFKQCNGSFETNLYYLDKKYLIEMP